MSHASRSLQLSWRNGVTCLGSDHIGLHLDSQFPCKACSSSRWSVRAAADKCNSYSHTPHNSRLTQIVWDFPRVWAQSHTTKHYLAVEQLQVMLLRGLDWSYFLCSVWLCFSQSDNSQCGFLTKWQTAQSSPIGKCQDELTCIKSLKLSRLYTSIYKSMYNIHLHIQVNVQHTPPWILQLSQSLWHWERARIISVRL